MLEYIKGKIVQLTPTAVIIEGGAIGYRINISLNTYTALDKQRAAGGADEVRLPVQMQIREDAWTLYGFNTEDERVLFRMLTGVSGVGAATAMLILSAFGAADLQDIISRGDVAGLKKVKGVGETTAKRIIADLGNKIKTATAALSLGNGAQVRAGGASAGMNDVFDQALAALLTLGYKAADSQKVLRKVLEAEPSMKVQDAIRRALPMLR